MENIGPEEARELLVGMRMAREVTWAAIYNKPEAGRDAGWIAVKDTIQELEEIVLASIEGEE